MNKNFLKNITSKYWRLNNLYKIYTKDNKKVTLHLNRAQQKILQIKHPRKIILKSRQQGVSTLYVAYNLDSVLTKPGYQAGIQSYGKEESKKLAKKAKIMWDSLPEAFKKLFTLQLVTRNSEHLEFSNESSLRIGNFRGDTLQSLHVSELAKIAKKYPEKAYELQTGAFQAIATGNKITVESTAEGAQGLFYDLWQKATRRLILTQGQLTPLDFYPIFLSWVDDPDCSLQDPYPIDAVGGYFEELEKKHSIYLTDQQKWWYAAKYDELGFSIYQEYPTIPEEAFKANIHGTYFHDQYDKIIREKRIQNIQYNPRYPVYASFDLGMNDETVILFAQHYDNSVYIIGEYHNSGKDIGHYSQILKALNYRYKLVFLPHDAAQRDLTSGRTRIQTFHLYGIHQTKLLPKLSFQDSIEAARNFLSSPRTHISENCPNLIKAIQNYRKKYDEKLDIYLNKDVHDIHSHYAASLRYLAQGLSRFVIERKKEPFKTVLDSFAV